MNKHIRSRFSFLACAVSICWLSASPIASGQQEKFDVASAASGDRVTGMTHNSQFLRQLNASLVTLTNRVSPAVVQVLVDGYGPSSEDRIRNNVSGVLCQVAFTGRLSM